MILSSFFEFFTGRKFGKKPLLIIAKDAHEAQSIASVATYFKRTSTQLEDIKADFGVDLRSFSDELSSLFKSLYDFYHAPTDLLIVPLKTAINYLPKPQYLQPLRYEFGDKIELKTFKSKLFDYGFTFVDVVEMVGEVSIRGDIIDVFSSAEAMPYRISLFDDEIESIRLFDPTTQKSHKEELESFFIMPKFLSLSPEESQLVLDGCERFDEFGLRDINAYGFWAIAPFGELLIRTYESIKSQSVDGYAIEAYSFGDGYPVGLDEIKTMACVPPASEYREVEKPNFAELIAFHQDKKIEILAKNSSLLKQHGLESTKGFTHIETDAIINLVSNTKLILSLNAKKTRVQKVVSRLLIDELSIGNYVVHEEYGVGVFNGLKQVKVLGVVSDFIEIAYQGEDKLLLPATNLEKIDRYVANNGVVPEIDRLGKGSFQKLRAKIKQKLLELASQIINLAALRDLKRGVKITAQNHEIKQFQQAANFEYTTDQTRSIEEIFEDVGSGKVMDRLLSGDVGFGKTEVAMNAIFACVQSGYQAIFIAPTTLLSSQHYHSLTQRFAPYGIRIGRLDSHVSTKDKNMVLRGLEDGSIQVAIGTHSLFSAIFSKLALVVVDEEHKFGVKQKEKIKELSTNVHLLSMSATPIPRTLNMALSQIKGMSQLFTPPKERIGVRTFVKEYEKGLIKEIILREQRRAGQVFYIFNRIAEIERKKMELLRILPELKIAVLHSQVGHEETEEIMVDFYERKYDLLLATSIVESGIHLPNANTIVVESADRFGIADLHQLRGRVGRGEKEGYCYFLVSDKEEITPEAIKRLTALENNSKLGSGYAIAYQDLEIRGGGNILGESQSGHIKNIGYGLYLKMFEEAINQLSGKMTDDAKELDLNLAVSAFINPQLVSEDRVRLELYRRLSHAKTIGAIYEIEEEMIDRFGKLDSYTTHFFSLMAIKVYGNDAQAISIKSFGQAITLQFADGKKVSLKAASKDDEDVIHETLTYLRGLKR